MIISASRRTDLPAYYSDWLYERLRQGEVLVRNPMNPRRVSRVSLRPEDVDGIVFWTKNPAPSSWNWHNMAFGTGAASTRSGWGGSCAARCARKRKKTSARPAGAPPAWTLGLTIPAPAGAFTVMRTMAAPARLGATRLRRCCWTRWGRGIL